MFLDKNGACEDKNNKCPLCSNTGPFQVLTSAIHIPYYLCDTCALIFMDRTFLPSPEIEKECYQTHENGPQYAGYVAFLNQAISPTLPYLDTDMRGLDYGCGPGPTIQPILMNEGIHCENYDPFFYPEEPKGCFDFVFATEAVEHFFSPGQEISRIHGLLKPGGIFTIMTEGWEDLTSFPGWYYAKDITHVSFYHADTIDYICKSFGFIPLHRENPRVSVLRMEPKAMQHGSSFHEIGRKYS
jgi:SAM-dependent methyltransferase